MCQTKGFFMTVDNANYDPAFFRRVQEQDKENITELKAAIEKLPEVKRRLFEMHERYTKAIQDLIAQISREKNAIKRKSLEEELGSYQASLAYIEPAYRAQYVALQATLMNNLIKIQSAHETSDCKLKNSNSFMDESCSMAASGIRLQPR